MRLRPVWPASELPRIRAAGRFPLKADDRNSYQHITFAIHQHFYDGTLVIGGHRFSLQKGDITVTPPDTASRYRLDASGYHWTVHFMAPELRDDLIPLPLRVPGSAAVHLGVRLSRIVSLHHAGGQIRKRKSLSLQAARVELLSLILDLAAFDKREISSSRGSPSDSILDWVRESLDQRFQEDISPVRLAAEAQLSSSWLAAKFRRRFGMTIDAYLLQRRIDLARHLLLATNKSIKEVAFACGIPDPHYFNKQFRRVAGVSPTLFRAHGT